MVGRVIRINEFQLLIQELLHNISCNLLSLFRIFCLTLFGLIHLVKVVRVIEVLDYVAEIAKYFHGLLHHGVEEYLHNWEQVLHLIKVFMGQSHALKTLQYFDSKEP